MSSTPRIAVIGSAMIDLFAPRAGQRLADLDRLAFTAGGSATIIAAAAARLGAAVAVVSAVGDDELGAEWCRRVSRLGIDVSSVVIVSGQLTPLSVSTVDLAGEKTYAFYRFPDRCDPLAALTLSDRLVSVAREVDVLVVTEAVIRARSSRATVMRLLEHRASARTASTLFSVNYRPSGWTSAAEAAAVMPGFASRADAVCCNRREYELLLRGESRMPAVVFETAGAEGAIVHVQGRVTRVPVAAVPGEVVLDTGAGDTFCGAVAVAMGEQRNPVEAATFATTAAALAVRRDGTTMATPLRHEVDALLAPAASAPGGAP